MKYAYYNAPKFFSTDGIRPPGTVAVVMVQVLYRYGSTGTRVLVVSLGCCVSWLLPIMLNGGYDTYEVLRYVVSEGGLFGSSTRVSGTVPAVLLYFVSQRARKHDNYLVGCVDESSRKILTLE